MTTQDTPAPAHKMEKTQNPYALKGWQWALTVITGLMFIWLAGFGLFTEYVRQMQPQNPTEATDAIIVLTGGAQRVNKGLDLLSTGQGKKLFITGVNGHVSLQEIMGLWRRPIIEEDANDCCIVLDHKARNTIQNAQETRIWAQKEQIKTLRLVTSDYHMPRARLEFHKNIPGIRILAWPVKAHIQSGTRNDFLRLTFEEYNKTLVTLVKFYLLPDSWRKQLEPLL